MLVPQDEGSILLGHAPQALSISLSLVKEPRNCAGAGSDTLGYEGMVVELLGAVDASSGEYTFGEKIERRGKFMSYS